MSEDYTDTQVQNIKVIKGIHVEDAEKCSKEAELHYRSVWGPRNRFNHVKAASTPNGAFHYSNKWLQFLKFLDNITVFYQAGKPVGWLFHKEINNMLTPCKFGGYDLDCTLNTMETYNPANAS